ncbi:protein of unknown function [Taphrina deformans PYCC 5710]|uniref:N-acetyltransferase domain-containing protein n=1 Tax=Taphrina deformans (strain PYCC 5710 / ATCC 11124 / CBS 356.35 / IMI 108563 / JCM 9778 / NBRC 8474) TaxID=1097556 RepID=R4XCZ4_TAPDE|nr:protein of unknown function [Taphrina deformans PYCC 5710]|eukprot:CCG83746.1 protein of unknown function [Taphrina deformans PYCC 5710]
METSFKVTRIDDPDFVMLTHELDMELAVRYDITISEIQNTVDPTITTALIMYKDSRPVACGCILPVKVPKACLDDLNLSLSDQEISPTITEMRRIFLKAEHRGSSNGSLALKLIQTLENLAVNMDSAAMVVKTGGSQPEALRVYGKSGYRSISLYGQPFEKGPTNSLGKELQ